ncbi:MAG: CgeB family protein [Janthinobacterium lividum]
MPASAGPLKILYASGLSENDSSLYRLWALERLGHTVVPLNAYAYEPQQAVIRKVLHRLQVGPWVQRLNRDILTMAERERPAIFWADKLLSLQPETLQRLRAMGVVTISYMIDNAFGPRRDPGWRLYRQGIPHFDLHVTQRDTNVADYKAHGARDVIKIQTAYEPTLHFPPPEGWSDQDRNRGVSFIGSPYDQRAEFLTRLWQQFALPVVISGSDWMWREKLSREAMEALYTGSELHGPAYREGVWRSRVNLSFLTHSNQDEFVHKSFEIAGCGAFLLAERSAGHLARFVEDQEAVFFDGIEECAAKIERYLPDEAARTRIAAAGHARAVRDGYGNDAQVARILERVRPLIDAKP